MYGISARQREKGSGVKQVEPVLRGRDVRRASIDRWCILVHGYNNSQLDAKAFWNRLEHRFTAVDGKATKQAVRFYWPGDEFPARIPSMAAYPLQISVAEECASELAKFVEEYAQTRDRPLTISFVAHSLGCFLTLETIAELRRLESEVIIDKVMLMAAAVPVGYCDMSLPDGYFKPVGNDTLEKVLYSQDDKVLKRYFQLGQAVAGRLPEWGKRAVGYSGGPGSGVGERWSSAKYLEGYDHGDYWLGNSSTAQMAPLISPQRRINEHELRRVQIREKRVETSTFKKAMNYPWSFVKQWPRLRG